MKSPLFFVLFLSFILFTSPFSNDLFAEEFSPHTASLYSRKNFQVSFSGAVLNKSKISVENEAKTIFPVLDRESYGVGLSFTFFDVISFYYTRSFLDQLKLSLSDVSLVLPGGGLGTPVNLGVLNLGLILDDPSVDTFGLRGTLYQFEPQTGWSVDYDIVYSAFKTNYHLSEVDVNALSGKIFSKLSPIIDSLPPEQGNELSGRIGKLTTLLNDSHSIEVGTWDFSLGLSGRIPWTPVFLSGGVSYSSSEWKIALLDTNNVGYVKTEKFDYIDPVSFYASIDVYVYRYIFLNIRSRFGEAYDDFYGFGFTVLY